MQGSPLSPCLYNLCTDHILEELSSPEKQDEFGYNLSFGLPNVTVLGFADDTLIIGKNEESASELTQLAIEKFREIGLEINTQKSKCLVITNGKLHYNSISLPSGQTVSSISPDETIKYLGVTYNATVFDPAKN